MNKWRRVSTTEPCPICGKTSYCTRTTDGIAVKCMRVESDKPAEDKNGSVGWVHLLANPLPPLPPPKPIPIQADWTEECKKMFYSEMAHEKRCDVADSLRVSVAALEALKVGVGVDEWNGAEFSSWPCRDDQGRCIGYTRRYDDGAKRTNQGGSAGVFYTPNWCKHPGPVWIVEGGSDVAACESAGMCAIGRASNTHGAGWIRTMLARDCPDKRAIVVGERDEAPHRRGTVPSCPVNCRGCSFCWPGLFGAKKVAGELGTSWVMVPRPFKDMREMVTAGAIWLDLIELI